MCRGCNYEQSEKNHFRLAKKWQKTVVYTYQNTYNGLSVALFNLHSKRNVDPSLICKSGASIISATASVCGEKERKIIIMLKYYYIIIFNIILLTFYQRQ